ncbi:MAG: DJ-1/PfpI family protein [Clostridia bacterium]|nr:DJ-1/PfpI family protein [Clostridia bacterium]
MVYILLTDGFEEIEALTPVDVLRRCGAQLLTAAVSEKQVRGSHAVTVEADITIDEIDKNNMEMLILPGGPGHTGLKTEKVHSLIRYAAEHDIYIASICAAPSVIGELGLLKNRRATCFPGYESALSGAVISTDKVVCDGKFITARGAGAASEFAFALAELLCGEKKADEIKNAMQY